jgi:hypothetical protein
MPGSGTSTFIDPDLILAKQMAVTGERERRKR